MPQIAAFAASAFTYVSSASAAVAAGSATLAQTLTVTAVNLAGSVAATAITSALSPGVGAEGSPTAFRLDTDAGIPVAFGHVATAGVVAHRASYGPTNRYQSVVATLSAGPVQGNYTIRIDDELTTFGSGGAAADGDHVNELWFTLKDGDQPDTALSSPSGLEGSATLPKWGADYKMNGRSAFMMTCFENSKFTAYRGGLPKPLVEFDGRFGYDPREDGTYPGGVGACRINDPDTWVYIDNPIIAALNWAIGIWEGDSGGGAYGVPYACSLVAGVGSSIDGIDVAAFVNAANVAEANGWGVAALPTTKDDKFQVMTALLQAGGAYPSRNAGRISCVTYGEAQASVVTVTAADTAGPVEVNLGQSRLERINTALPRFWSSNHRWQMTQLGPVSNSAWVTEDASIKRTRGIDFPYVGDGDQAAQLAYYAIADAREAVTGRVPFKPHMRQVQPGDCFTFDEPGFLLDGVKVKCLKRSIDPMTLKVMIEFRQETDAKHAAALAQTANGPGTVTPTGPDTFEVDPPTLTSISVSGDTVTIGWTNGEARFFRTFIYYSPDSTFANAVQIGSKGGDAGEAQTATHKPGPGTWYYWLVTRSGGPGAYDLSDPVSLGSVVVTVEIDTDNLNDLNILRRTGGGDFTGDLDATDGADWTTNVTGRPTELTDGRITTALNASGVLQTAIPSTLADSSNLLRRTGGGLFSGDLAATAGADWSANVSNRPTELTDGRIGTALNASGVLQTAIPSALADTSNLLRYTGGGSFTGALNANYITNTNELTDGANLGQTAVWSSVSSRPANLASLSGSEGILNSAISLSADGVLTGAGTSVQVNLSSLPGTVGTSQVADGAISGTKLADAAVDLASAKVTGKSLANVDNAAATKLAGIESGAQVNPANLAELDHAAATALAGKADASSLGPLATSALTEAKVRGRYLGAYAGNAAAITAGLQDGDIFIDTSLTPRALKVQESSVITEVDMWGIQSTYSAQTDVASTSDTPVASIELTVPRGASIVAWFVLEIETSPENTRQSISGASQPDGTWQIVEIFESASRQIQSGTWSATPVGSGGGTDDYINIVTVDGAANTSRAPSRGSLPLIVPSDSTRTYSLLMALTSGRKSLLDAGFRLYVQVQRTTS